jgi:alkanesulfonate monooxygenase SsuD/methylene tetrahydromethanopterin reductase-like flavin-dependent oxidoreductase (luciferase family)
MSDSSGEEALLAYRDGFVPSPLCPEPCALVAVGVVCADTDEEAARLASSELFRRGVFAEQGEETPLIARRLLAGSPGSLRGQLESLALSYGIDEFIVVTMIADYRARLRSYELLGQLLSHD